jgi:hypothetical protein
MIPDNRHEFLIAIPASLGISVTKGGAGVFSYEAQKTPPHLPPTTAIPRETVMKA